MIFNFKTNTPGSVWHFIVTMEQMFKSTEGYLTCLSMAAVIAPVARVLVSIWIVGYDTDRLAWLRISIIWWDTPVADAKSPRMICDLLQACKRKCSACAVMSLHPWTTNQQQQQQWEASMYQSRIVLLILLSWFCICHSSLQNSVPFGHPFSSPRHLILKRPHSNKWWHDICCRHKEMLLCLFELIINCVWNQISPLNIHPLFYMPLYLWMTPECVKNAEKLMWVFLI